MTILPISFIWCLQWHWKALKYMEICVTWIYKNVIDTQDSIWFICCSKTRSKQGTTNNVYMLQKIIYLYVPLLPVDLWLNYVAVTMFCITAIMAVSLHGGRMDRYYMVCLQNIACIILISPDMCIQEVASKLWFPNYIWNAVVIYEHCI